MLTLVAPPALVEIAAHMVAAGDKLLDADIDAAGRRDSTPISGSTSINYAARPQRLADR